jgi:hypothetical protein
MSPSIITEAARPNTKIFRRLYIKRRLVSTGLFETNWVNISNDVERWGKIQRSIDAVRYSKFTLSDLSITLANDRGAYNPHDEPSSLWYGYANQQRTLVKVEAGFLHQTLAASGIWINTEYPSTPVVMVGVVAGDIMMSDKNRITLPVKPLAQIFRDYPARNLTGFTSTGLTASQFVTMLRDQTDGSGSLIFRPFFQDTTTYWDFTSTTNVYGNLNTQTAEDLREMDCWEVLQKLAEAEDLVVHIKRDGTFRFGNRSAYTTTAAWEFYGRGFTPGAYGHQIKAVDAYGKKLSTYYSRVEVKWVSTNTYTALRVRESAMLVNGTNAAWNLGLRTFKFENFWIPTSTVADTILENIFNNVSSLKEEIKFSATFVPNLEVLDRVKLYYDSSEKGNQNRWDVQDWALEDTSSSNDLIWDKSIGDAIYHDGTEFKITALEIDLDGLTTRITAQQL